MFPTGLPHGVATVTVYQKLIGLIEDDLSSPGKFLSDKIINHISKLRPNSPKVSQFINNSVLSPSFKNVHTLIPSLLSSWYSGESAVELCLPYLFHRQPSLQTRPAIYAPGRLTRIAVCTLWAGTLVCWKRHPLVAVAVAVTQSWATEPMGTPAASGFCSTIYQVRRIYVLLL